LHSVHKQQQQQQLICSAALCTLPTCAYRVHHVHQASTQHRVVLGYKRDVVALLILHDVELAEPPAKGAGAHAITFRKHPWIWPAAAAAATQEIYFVEAA
jgi:hypothetical protein